MPGASSASGSAGGAGEREAGELAPDPAAAAAAPPAPAPAPSANPFAAAPAPAAAPAAAAGEEGGEIVPAEDAAEEGEEAELCVCFLVDGSGAAALEGPWAGLAGRVEGGCWVEGRLMPPPGSTCACLPQPPFLLLLPIFSIQIRRLGDRRRLSSDDRIHGYRCGPPGGTLPRQPRGRWLRQRRWRCRRRRRWPSWRQPRARGGGPVLKRRPGGAGEL